MLTTLTNTQKRLLALSLAICAAFYLGVVIVTGYEVIHHTIARLGILDWGLLLICSLLNYSLRFVRWHLYAKHLGHRLNKWRHYLYYLSGFALTTTPGKAGETIRSVYLRQHGLRYTQSLAMFFSERFLDVIVIASLSALTVFLFSDYYLFVLITSLAIVSFLPLLKSPLFIQLLAVVNRRIPWPRLRRLLDHLQALLEHARLLLQTRLLVPALLLGLCAWALQGLAFYFILLQLEFNLPLAGAMGIYAISLLAGAVSFIPGGVGSTEIVMGLLLAASGADTGTAVAAPLISRLSTLWFAVALGLFANSLLSSPYREGNR